MGGAARPTVGFDFGTSTTLVASADEVVHLSLTAKDPWLPSLVGYADDGAIVAGEPAQFLPLQQVVRSIKRAITDRRDFVRVDRPTGITDVRADDLMVEVLREAARLATDERVDLTGGTPVHLGCPAMWDGRQRRRLLDVADRAGLPVRLEDLIDEPVAAGIAWLAEAGLDASRAFRVVVFDMGGGTLDIAVLQVHGGRHGELSVLAALGAPEAGDTLDESIAEDLDLTLAADGIDVDSLPQAEAARGLLVDAARKVKVRLSTQLEEPLALEAGIFGKNDTWYTREQLEAVFAPQMDRAEQYLAAALRAARLTEPTLATAYDIARTPIDDLVDAVDAVVLSGGMSQIPYVRQRLQAFFTPTTRIEPATEPPENAVVLGLARAGRYGRINMYRPAFDILLDWDDPSESRTVYEAFTPLVSQGQISRGGNDLRYKVNGLDLKLPNQGRGNLRVVSHSGERVRAELGGASLDGFPVAFSEQTFEFSIYPNGLVRMVDGGGSYDGRVLDWQTMDPDGLG